MNKKYEIHMWDEEKDTWKLIKSGRESLTIREKPGVGTVEFFQHSKPQKLSILRVGTPNNTNSWNALDYFETNMIVDVKDEVVKEVGDVEIIFETADFRYKWVDKNVRMV